MQPLPLAGDTSPGPAGSLERFWLIFPSGESGFCGARRSWAPADVQVSSPSQPPEPNDSSRPFFYFPSLVSCNSDSFWDTDGNEDAFVAP